jgi:fibronectin-binding autotransporter adhesin
LIVAGGTLTLSGTNTYTGMTTIDLATTLALTGGGSIATSSGVIDNGTFDISQTSLGAAITTLSGSGTVALGARLLSITAGSTTFAGVIADGGIGGGTGGMLAVTGGTQTLSGVNTYTGGTQINGGAALALSGLGSIATSTFVNALGTFDISQTTSGASIMTLAGSGNVALGAQELTITNGWTTFSGVLADGGIGGGTKGSLIVSGGTETLSGVNTYTGDTTIAPNPTTGAATLALTGNGSIATSSVVAIATKGTFDISQTLSGASIMTLADSGANPSGHVLLGAQTLTITNGSTTFSGVIADGGIGGGIGGNLTVTGGTQTLAGVNTYTGLTTIAPSAGTATLALKGNGSIATSSEVLVATNGALDISGTNAGASIVTLSGSGSVMLGSQVLTLTAAAAGPAGTNPAGIFSGVISGLGGMAITGGHEELTGLNTYKGGTLVTNGAMLSVNSSSSLGASTSTLTLNNGTLVVDGSITIPQPVTLLGAPPGTDLINLNSNNLTLSGVITGPGVLTVISGGTLNLTGTVNNVGGIVLGPGTTFTASTSANAGLATTPIVLVPTSGTAANLFTGSVHVVGPLDVVNGATPELIILPGDTLVGVGSVNATVVVQGGGASAPGDGPGTIVVNAPVTDLPGSTYTVQIDGPVPSATNCVNPLGCAGQYGSVIVTGAGNTYTAGGTIAPVLRGIGAPANNNYTPPVTTSFTVVTATAGVLGSFSSLTQPAVGSGLAAGTRFDALYFNAGSSAGTSAINFAQNAAGNPTAVDLWVTPASYQNLSPWNTYLSKNQSQVAYALDALRGVNDLNPALSLPAGLKNSPQATWDFGQLFPQQPQNLPAIFNRLSGEVSADPKLVALQMTNQFLELMLDSTVNGRSGRTGAGALGFAPTDQGEQAQAPDAALDYAAVSKAPKSVTFEQRWSAWGSAFGGGIKASGDPVVGSTDVSARTYGVGGGMDYRISPDTAVGFAVAGGATNWGLAQGLGNGRSDVFQAGVYGTTHFGPAYLASALTLANHWMTTDRLAIAGDHLQSAFDAQSYGARVEAGFRYAMPMVAVTPYVAATVQRFSTPSYSETDSVGGGFGLNYNAAAATEIRGEAGARFDSLIGISENMSLMLRARGAWAYDKISDRGLVAMFEAALLPSALPGSGVGFSVNGAALPNSVALASAGAELRFTNNWSLLAKFDGELARGWRSYTGNGTLRYSW